MSQIREIAFRIIKCCEERNSSLLHHIFDELEEAPTTVENQHFLRQIFRDTLSGLEQNYPDRAWFCEQVLFSKILPCVTDILKTTALEVSRKEKGQGNRNREEAKSRGKRLHSYIKSYLTRSTASIDLLDLQPWINSVKPILNQLEYVRLLEKAVFHPELLYSSRVDCVASWRGVDHVVEWKTAQKFVQEALDEHITQAVAYLAAINEVHKLALKNVLIVIVLPNEAAKVFQYEWNTLCSYLEMWKSRVNNYKRLRTEDDNNSRAKTIHYLNQESSKAEQYVQNYTEHFNLISQQEIGQFRFTCVDNQCHTIHASDVSEASGSDSPLVEDALDQEVELDNLEDDSDDPRTQAKKKHYTEDSIRLYLQEIGRIRLLRADEEIELARKIADLLELERIRFKLADKLDREPSDADWASEVNMALPAFRRRLYLGRRAKDKLVQSNLRLVVSIAKKYMNRGLSFQDLIQEGSLGLIRAAEKFDHEKGYKFSTYATWWIQQAIPRAIADQSRTIRLPVHLYETISRIKKVIKLLSLEMGRDPTEGEIATRMEMTIEKLRFITKSAQSPISLNTPITESNVRLISLDASIEEDDACLGDVIQAECEAPEEHLSKHLLREDLEGVLATLSRREKDVLRLRYGLDDGRMKTLEEIGQIFNATRERIRQIEAKALRKLRHPSRNSVLKEYIR